MTNRFFVKLIKEKGWQPCIKGHWISLTNGTGGMVLTFKDHETFTLRCSYSVARALLAL